jgi:hypothetical protein
MNIRILFVLMASTLGGCASTNSAPLQTGKLNPADYQPPTDFEMTVNDNQKDPATGPDTYRDPTEDEYERSLVDIRNTFSTEGLVFKMCTEVHGDPSKYCYDVLTNPKTGFCQTDMILDARGGHHTKPYCTRTYLDLHNPIKNPYHPNTL